MALVTAEMALAVVLLIAAALLIRTVAAVRAVNTGIETRNVLTMRMLLAGPQFETAGGTIQVLQDGIRRIRSLPGVTAAATSCCVPFVDRFFLSFQVAGRPDVRASSGWTLVSPGYFDVLGISLVRGRTFTDDDESGPRVVVINEALAKRVWPNTDPINEQIIVGDGNVPHQIIGVVRDVRDTVTAPARGNIYMLSAHLDEDPASLITLSAPWAWLVRTEGAPRSLSSAIGNELRQASGDLPVARIATMDEILAEATARENFNMLVLTIFGAAAVWLAAVGIYGLMAYSVTQRAREMAVRLALGAAIGSIRRMVVIQGLRPVLVGTVFGVAMAFGGTRLLSSLLFGVQPRDPLMFLVAPTLLMVIAVVAIWLPAVRATRINPNDVLRSE